MTPAQRVFVDEAMAAQEARCFYCGGLMTWRSKNANRVTLEHRQPLGRGGNDERSNWAAACKRCNEEKGSLTEAEYRLLLGKRRNVVVRFNPFDLVLDSFAALYPSHRASIVWSEAPEDAGDSPAFGHTCWPDAGGDPEIAIFMHTPLSGAVEVLAHELAHVVAGPDAEHGPCWETAFAAIHQEYERRFDLIEAESK